MCQKSFGNSTRLLYIHIDLSNFQKILSVLMFENKFFLYSLLNKCLHITKHCQQLKFIKKKKTTDTSALI